MSCSDSESDADSESDGVRVHRDFESEVRLGVTPSQVGMVGLISMARPRAGAASGSESLALAVLLRLPVLVRQL
jgi:hypothetical protein